jgi:hypothetical protein
MRRRYSASARRRIHAGALARVRLLHWPEGVLRPEPLV